MSDEKTAKPDSKAAKAENSMMYCSFCGKSQHEVRKLIAGPSVLICDECVELCRDIIREETKNNRLTEDELLDKKSIDRVHESLDKIAPGNAAFRGRILSDAIGFLKLRLADRNAIKNLKMLFVGPRGCDVPRLLDAIWSALGLVVIKVDASDLREGSFQERRNMLLQVVQAHEYNIERAQNQTVVIVENLDRVCKSTEEFQRIQEDLEVIINGTFVAVPPEGGRKHPQQELLNIDTSKINFFATTSLLHESAAPVVGPAEKTGARYGDMRLARQELIARGMLRDLVNAFDDVVEYDPITTDEVAGFLRSDNADSLLGELTALNIRLDSQAIPKVLDLLIARGEGMKSLRSVVNLIAMRAAFSQTGAQDADDVTAEWLESNI